MKKIVAKGICVTLLTAQMVSMTACAGKQTGSELHVIDDKYRTFYEVFVYSFADSNRDGIGDLKGLTEKLDYINDGDDATTEDLGANGIWLMPIMPSTTYHKYDVKDYMDIDRQYGTMEDFDSFMQECNARDIHVILDLVMNHTSAKHEWFETACEYLKGLDEGEEPSEEECKYVGYYNFSKEKKANYYKVYGSDWYYEGKFWDQMPDLNLFNENLRKEFEEIVAFWMDKGVAGFRLDAVKEFESDNTTKNVEILTWFNGMVKAKKEDAYIVGEAWTGASTYAEYYASGIDSLFDFQFGDSKGIIANAVKHVNKMDARSYANALVKEQNLFAGYNENYINAPFYTNHDMARSAGYYFMPEVDTAQTKLAQAMNLLMTGNVFLYYGEELGMKGSGKDENKRLAMYWSEDAKADYMCHGPMDAEKVEQKYPSLEQQEEDPYSIYNYVKQTIRIRNTYPAIGRGVNEVIEQWTDENIAAVKKTYDEEQIILVYNISDTAQTIDLSEVTLGEEELTAKRLAAKLLVDEQDIVTDSNRITLPSYAVAVFR
ncbi:MAG: alpha-amylase [Acetatifactor sp.]|nr:alpha-amylase [Acetatifactor sp.]